MVSAVHVLRRTSVVVNVMINAMTCVLAGRLVESAVRFFARGARSTRLMTARGVGRSGSTVRTWHSNKVNTRYVAPFSPSANDILIGTPSGQEWAAPSGAGDYF